MNKTIEMLDLKPTDMTDSRIIPQIIDDMTTEYIKEEEKIICKKLFDLNIDKDILINQVQEINRLNDILREYKELEEQGLLLKLPCKVGSTIYQLINSHIYEYKVIGICFDIFQNKWMYEVAYEIGLEWFKTMCDFDVFGKSKTVFLTKEEAEQALKRLE